MGPGFETRLIEKEGSNPLFVFLNPNDPYNKYFKQRIKLVKENKLEEKEEAKQTAIRVAQEEAMKPPPLPPPPYEFHYELPHLSKQDQSIIKLTAQFAAKNGPKFPNLLGQKEQSNFQFEFLRPSSSLYPYYIRLVDHYTKVLNQSKSLLSAINSKAHDRYHILELISKRLEFEAFALNEQEKRQRTEQDKQRIISLMI